MPRMPYQPQPPADYVSPAPTFGPLYPDPCPYDLPSVPHLSPPFNYTNMADHRILALSMVPSVIREPSVSPPREPIPQTPSRNSRYAAPPPMAQRHSVPAQARPPIVPPNHPHSAPEVRRTPSEPIRRAPRENAAPHRMEIPIPNIAPPLSARTSYTPPSTRTSSTRTSSSRPPSSRPSSRAPSSRTSSSRSSTAKSLYAPSHIPRKLVMPMPLQQQQQTSNHQSWYPPPMSDYSVPSNHSEPQALLMPRAEAIPMIQDEKGARHLLRKKTANHGAPTFANVPGLTKSKSLSSAPPREQDPPAKKARLAGLFRGSSTGSRLGRKLSKRK